MNARSRPRSTPHLVWALLLLLPIACTLLGAPLQDRVPVQGWKQARGPVVPHDSFPDDCRLCHAGTDWHELRADFTFDHGERTGVPLVGRHAEAECLRCHNDRGPVRVFAARGCSGCHEDWHRGKLGQDCAACHDEKDWKPNGMVSGHALTRFPLTGAHAGAPCWACHKGAESGLFEKQPTDCLHCHADDLASAVQPDHQANGWVRDCQRCHGTTTWGGADFRHDFFPLTGAHAATSCEQCHAGGRFRGTPSDCASCHEEAWATVTSPDHRKAGFSKQCGDCHSTAGWKGADFKHHWPLGGAHALASCEDCHQGGTYANASTDCWSCHEDDYRKARNPDHQNASFPTDCKRCHTDRGWTGADFRHEWPLAGRHADAQCGACHGNQNWSLGPKTCADCHQKDYEAAKEPDHRAVKFSTRCEDCHQPSGWKGADFVHKWALVGVHKTVSCEACHAGRVYEGTSADCWSCHKLAYRRPRSRTTSRPASRPTARPAITRSAGAGPTSSTPGRSSAPTRRPSAGTATRATCGRARPRTATPATGSTTRRPRTPTTARPPSRPSASAATTRSDGRGPTSSTSGR
ncbi:MAG: cytochrome c3 family protein [Planctomycetota bacterium]